MRPWITHTYVLDIEILNIERKKGLLFWVYFIWKFSHEMYNWDKYECIYMYNTWFGKVGIVKTGKASNSLNTVT